MENETTKVTVLIVEDEALVAQDINTRLIELDYQVAGIASSADKALQILDENPTIDILLLDIILKGDRDGIELAREVKERYGLPFIFLTSHADDQLVERAKRVRPSAYFLKPFNDRAISIAIELALCHSTNRNPENKIISEDEIDSEENKVLQLKDVLFLKRSNHFEKVAVEDIYLLKADKDVTIVYAKTGRLISSMDLKILEEILPGNRFIRVHKSYVANILAVTSFEGNLLYVNDMKVPVSKPYRDRVFEFFKTI